jgi:uncharacterized membrane protein YheB (UPF0754 family)
MPKSTPPSISVTQSGATAGKDIVGGDKIEFHHHVHAASIGIVEKLILKLKSEMRDNAQVQHTIDALANFQMRKSVDGIDGLEAKLVAGQRQDELMDALEKKEQFAKLLQKWSLYASAQEIFAYLLAKAEYEFNHFIYPQITTLPRIAINQIVHDRIVQTTIDECGVDVFVLNHGTALGMVYWLAEQCFVRWHK